MKIRNATKRTAWLSAIALATLMSMGDVAWAQRGGGDSGGGGDRGGSRGGDRGGDRGGSRGMGGPGMGGPGMGAPGMGGPGFGGGGFGGPPGGFGGGGFGGGGFGGGGFGGGSFSPIDMLRRFDRNGNNMLDPDEMEGPARFFVDRMAQNNPRIDVSRPIPLDRLAGEMDRMRQERGGAPGMPGAPGATTTAPKEPEPLVPGFDKIEEKPAVQGFGVPDENSSIKIEERDLREADDRLRRYDTNKDGVLSKEEMANSRWSDDPMQYDRNRDGKLTKNELAVRYAKRRLAELGGQPGQPGAPNTTNNSSRFAGMSSSWGSRGGDNGASSWGNRGGDNGGGWGNRDGKSDDIRTEDKKEQPASYRSGSTRDKSNATKGLPDWFARSDANNDGQVMMSEYSPNWSPDKVEEFAKFDLNNDGIVTSRECLLALKNSGKSTSGIASTTIASTSSSSSPSIVSKIGETSLEEANKAWAERMFLKYDKNKDGKLTVDEWSTMINKPKEGTDANGDGFITVDEYAKSKTQ